MLPPPWQDDHDLVLERQHRRWVVASEALFFSRPLLQALLNQWFGAFASSPTTLSAAAASPTASSAASSRVGVASGRLRALALAVLVDLLALWCWFKAEGLRLSRRVVAPLSEAEREERQRRKMTYLFYLLRAPLWDGLTRPVVDAVERGKSAARSRRALTCPLCFRFFFFLSLSSFLPSCFVSLATTLLFFFLSFFLS